MSEELLLPDGEVLARRVVWARSARSRARGLIGRPPLADGEALVLTPGRQVHTFGMRYAIDVVFCDADWRVRRVVRGLRPRRVTRWVARTRYLVELPYGASARVAPGARLVLRRAARRAPGEVSRAARRSR